MGRYPFRDYVDQYMDSMHGVYAEETWKTRNRRYRRMEQHLIALKDKGRVSTLSPKNMTIEDVRAYLLDRREAVSPADLVHEVVALRRLLESIQNPAVALCLAKYPGLRPVVKHSRLPAMEDGVYEQILKRSAELNPSEFESVRAYALVLLCLRTGCRNKEIRLAQLQDLNTTSWIMDIVHVKGETTYGQPRRVPVHPEVRQLVLEYLIVRKQWMADNVCDSPALFPSKDSKDGYLSGNSIRMIKDFVEKDLGIRFELRACRRTFGQKYLDAGLDIESTSVLMGHSSTKTTERYYSRKRLDTAMSNAENTW